jgi:hypothetical protein
MTSKFMAIKVRPANRDIPRAADGTLPSRWLLVEWPDDKDEPTDYWLSNMDDNTPLEELVRLAKIRWRIEHDYRELKVGLGLDHFARPNEIRIAGATRSRPGCPEGACPDVLPCIGRDFDGLEEVRALPTSAGPSWE